MDDSARGIATAALTLQSDLLRALVRKALLTRAEALDIVDSSLLNAASHPDAEATLGQRDHPNLPPGRARGACRNHRPNLIPELDIYRAAKLLIDQHGDDAPIRGRRADELLDNDDTEGALVWRAIVRAIEELRRERRSGELLN